MSFLGTHDDARRTTAPRGPYALAAGLALLSFLAVGCTEQPVTGTPSASVTGRPAEAQPLPEKKAQAQEEAQVRRAKAALGPDAVDEPAFVESGTGRVVEGVRNLSMTRKGEAYTISLVCVGTGSVQAVVAAGAPTTVPCDGKVKRRTVENLPAGTMEPAGAKGTAGSLGPMGSTELPLTITGAPGSTGVFVWQIESFSRSALSPSV